MDKLPLTPAGLRNLLQSNDWQQDLRVAMRRLSSTIAIDRKRLADGQISMGCHLSLSEASALDQALTLMCAMVLTSTPTTPNTPPNGRN